MTAIRKAFAALVFGSAVSQMGVAHADGTVVVELYTSQGCSSCPPADKIVAQLRGSDRILPLSLNVDYWDYLGWKDDLALPGNAKRQRLYAKVMGKRRVYTPQMVIDGRVDVIGSRKHEVNAAVNANLAHDDDVTVLITARPDGQLNVSASSASAANENATIWVVGFKSDVIAKVERGENSGHDLHYANVVREWREAATWNRAQPLSMVVPKPKGEDGVAVIVQVGHVGEILGASHLTYAAAQ